MSNHIRDPTLNQGYSYMVEESRFQQHLTDFERVVVNDKSTCVNHDAIKSANMRGGKGVNTSGAGTVECSRHDMKRANAVGDLQKGERLVSSSKNDSLLNSLLSFFC